MPWLQIPLFCPTIPYCLFSKRNLSLMMRSGKMHSDFQPSDLEKTLKYIVLQLDYLHANLRFSKILY